ncbi:RsmD family RNA methyltransferase, partial [Lancefieldella parvula]|uniref:RsmD family RNA methyltransferase n=1 Tax=Lancefieldella parvula TaxID=1382 RepID=UPI0036196549
SRGALYATFVDKDRKTCDRIKRTAKSLGVASSEMSVICGDTVRLAESSQLFGTPFDVVILDPPYAVEVEVVSKLLKDLIQSESLTNDAVVVYEHSHKTDSASLDDFELSKSKRYGIAQVDVLVRCEG